MAKYLFQVSYTASGTGGLLKEGGTSRRSMIEQVIKKLGGSVEAFYYAFGDVEVFVIADLPNDATAAAFSLTVSSRGTVTIKTTPLISPETIDEATKIDVGYHPAGS
ncbi:MAG: GYD domain-containing protein [Chloroflexi bacterium]|nr:GYD domain-containing protein [Chloroflexota bacterium]